MNAVTAPDEQVTAADNGSGNRSDSDTDLEDSSSSQYYQPISNGHHEADSSDDESLNHHYQLPNGHAPMENELSSLDLTDDEAEVEEERMQETEMERALREDERRRNAPLPPETAGRVMEAMRGIRFTGPPPQWAGRVPDQELFDRVRERAQRALIAAYGWRTPTRNRRDP